MTTLKRDAGAGERHERGAVAIIVGVMMVVLGGMAAIALDAGQSFDARRNAQAAVDIGLLSGAQDVPFSQTDASERIADEIRTNLDMEFTDAEWAAMWSIANCTDGEKFDTPGEVLGVATNCISFDDTGRVRVRLPDLSVETFFGALFGKDEIIVHADAVGFVRYAGIGGVLPFTVLGGAEDGSQICLRSASGGTAVPPCDGSDSGNFHALDVNVYGDAAFETDGIPCNTNKNDVFVINISKGVDHLLRVHTGIGVTDSCAKPFGPNQFYTFTGLGNGLYQGLIEGEWIGGVYFPGRLTNLDPTGETIDVSQGGGLAYTVDDTALWNYIPYGFTTDDAPSSCFRETFDALSFTDATAHIATCLDEYQDDVDDGDGDTYVPLFTRDADGDGFFDIESNPRFAIVPQTIETTLPRGKKTMRIGGFKAVWVQGLYFNDGSGGLLEWHPGDPATTLSVASGTSPLDQVTGYLLPDNTVEAIIGLTDEHGGEVAGSNVIELLE